MSTTTVLTTEKPKQWLARRRDDVEKMLGGGKRDDDYVPERLKHAARPATKPDRALQLVFALGVLVPFLAFAFLDPAGARDAFALQYATLAQLPSYIMTGPFVAAVLCLCVERVCYTLVWCFPKAFAEFCSKHNLGPPVDVIVRLFGVNKFFQLLGFAHLYLLGGLAPPPSLFALGVGAALVVWGQALNVGARPASRDRRRRRDRRSRRHLPRDRQGGGLLRLQVRRRRAVVHGLPLHARPGAPAVPRVRGDGVRVRAALADGGPRPGRLRRPRARPGAPLRIHGVRRAQPIIVYLFLSSAQNNDVTTLVPHDVPGLLGLAPLHREFLLLLGPGLRHH